MKTKIILPLIFALTTAGCGSTGNTKSNMVGQSTKAVMSQEKLKGITWSGVVVQTVNNKTNTCFQVIETVPVENDKPVYKALKDDSRFIVCKAGQLDAKKYDNRLITVNGDIVTFHKTSETSQFPIVEASDIKVWDSQKVPTFDMEKQFRDVRDIPRHVRPNGTTSSN